MYPYISAQQIADADIPLRDVYDLVLEGFELHGRDQYELPPKQGVHTRPGAFMHAMPGYLPSKDLAGTKLVSVYPDNPGRGLPTTTGVIVMMDPESGQVLALLDATWITNARTAMVSMVDTAHLANPDPVFGLVGATGASGRAHLEAIATIYPGSRVLVNSRSRQRCEELAEEFASLPLDLAVTMSQEALVQEADVVVVCTSYLAEPILDTAWLRPGQNLLNVHSRGWAPDFTAHVDLVSCDDRRQLLDPTNGLHRLYPELAPDIELGEVVAGAHPGRQDPAQIIASFNYGLSIFDVLVADHVMRRV